MIFFPGLIFTGYTKPVKINPRLWDLTPLVFLVVDSFGESNYIFREIWGIWKILSFIFWMGFLDCYPRKYITIFVHPVTPACPGGYRLVFSL